MANSPNDILMSTSKERFVERVRQAIREGNRPGHGMTLEPRGRIGYQGAGSDPVARFRDEFTAAGGHFHRAATIDAASDKVLQLVQEKAASRVLLGRGPVLDSLNMFGKLSARCEIAVVNAADQEPNRDQVFAADIGISGVDFLVAETGTIVVQSRPEEPRSLSLLPPVHIAVAARSQLVPDLFDLFAAMQGPEGPSMPSCLTLITGPSKTGDIELRLVTGVHGPGEIHLVLIEA
jgi:L-lactate utilization protein LutC